MKKIANLVIVFALVLCFLLAGTPHTVQAITFNPPQPIIVQVPGVAAGSWQILTPSVTGSEVSMDIVAGSAPSWLQLLTNSFVISGPALICHPFRGGQFHWVGQIRELVDGKWVMVATTNAWVPSTEGEFMSCAKAPAAGTYALFGYYNGPIEVPAAKFD